MSLPPSPGSRPTPTTQDGLTDPEGADGVVVEVVEQTPDPLRVLLIEDNPDHAALVEAYLADVHDPVIRLDHVTTVEAGTAALDAAGAAADPFHVVLADQQLPDSQYWETVWRHVLDDLEGDAIDAEIERVKAMETLALVAFRAQIETSRKVDV